MEPEKVLADLNTRLDNFEATVDSRLTAIEEQMAELSKPPTTATAVEAEADAKTKLPTGAKTRTGAKSDTADADPPSIEDLLQDPDPSSSRSQAPAGGARVTVPQNDATGRRARRFEFRIEALTRWAGLFLVVVAALSLLTAVSGDGMAGAEAQWATAGLIGLALLASAIILSGTRRRLALSFGNGGAVVVILTAVAAHQWLDLYDDTVGLGLVAAATLLSIMVALRIRMESVAITATLTMFLLPTWVRIVADAPVLITMIWLGLFALIAFAVGIDQRWTLYRVIATWTVAIWVVGLAASLSGDGDTSFMGPGVLLVAVVSAILWLNPTVAGAIVGTNPTKAAAMEPTGGFSRWLGRVEHHLVAVVPLWSWAAVLLYAGFEADVPGGWIGLFFGIAYFSLGLTAGSRLGGLDRRVQGSHLLGAGLLITVSFLVWLDSPYVMLALALQGLITLIVAQGLMNRTVGVYAYLLAGLATLALLLQLADAINRGSGSIGSDPETILGYVLVVVVLGLVAWRAQRSSIRYMPDIMAGLAWIAAWSLGTALIAPEVDGRGWLVLGVVLSLASVAAYRRLGIVVLGVAEIVGLITVLWGGLSIIEAATNGAEGLDHLANLSVVMGLWIANIWAWRSTNRIEQARALFVVAWLWSLGWVASVLVAGPRGQVVVSVAWALAAALAIIAAIRTGERAVQTAGFLTLFLLVAKLLTIDLARLDLLWRVGLFLLIGIGLLALAYALPGLSRRFRRAPQPPRGPQIVM